jgi:iron complex outermembrane receptor protein
MNCEGPVSGPDCCFLALDERLHEGKEMSNRYLKGSLLATTVIASMAFTGPAFAQDTTNQPGTQTSTPTTTGGAPTPGTPDEQAPTTNVNAPDEGDEIVVTGTLLRRTNSETPSPVTVMSSESLAQRGINTVAEAVQRLSANNAGTIQQGWNTGFNFASGANAPSLRGLTVQATLSIFDGLRMAPYPLADDGQRNFVDLNTIPNAIIDRIEILRDGASSTYGADAIAGVINVITKKEIQGLHLNGSGGISSRGDAGERRLDATFGYGDLAEQGFNAYVSAEYQKQDELWARDRGYPFNSADLSRICDEASGINPAFPMGTEVCLHNGNWNGTSSDGFFNGLISIPGVTLVRRTGLDPNLPANDPMRRFQFLNPAAGCNGWPTVAVTPAQSNTAPLTSCEVDFQEAYIMLQPEIRRRGVSGRVTFAPGGNHSIYAMANYYITDTFASFTPLGFNGTPTPPIPATLGAYNVLLPVYVCPTGVGTPTGNGTGCTAANGVLNPYNPFAAEGFRAQAFLRSPRGRTVDTESKSLRGVIGASGSFLGGFNYSADLTASRVKLNRTQSNYLIPQRIMDVVAQGTFNFANPELNPQSIWDYIAPDQSIDSVSKLWQATGTIGKDLFELPGGPLQAAVGLQYRKESIDAPSANPCLCDANGVPDPTQNQYNRYYSINSVGTSGSRNVKSAYFEIGAPVLHNLEFNVSGRYDKYSTGQKNFSPKVGAKFTPVPQLAIRGTWSKGFRIPSFNESFGLPTTGYVGQTLDCTSSTFAAFCAAHGGNAYATGTFPLGLTQVGDPNLDPEKSTNITAGAIFEPIRNVSFTVDFWNIKIKDQIVAVTDVGPIVAAYYAGSAIPPGFIVIPGAPDPAFPNAQPHIGFIQSAYRNASSQIARGIDFGANAKVNVFGHKLSSFFEASYLMKYVLTDENGTDFRYDGTLSPCNITSCSGAPKWRASWQNTLELGRATVSATAYYTSGYDQASTDFGGVRGDCTASATSGNSVVVYPDGRTPVQCRAPGTWNVDMTGAYRVTDKLTLFTNVLNVFDIDAPFDPSAAYHLFQFNPAWAGPNIVGRYFRFGAKVDF